MDGSERRRAGGARWLWLAGWLATAAGGAAAWAQPSSPPPATTAAEEADHAALRQFKALFEKAVNENNLDLMKPYLDQPFSVVTYTDREFSDFEAFKARWQQTRAEVVGDGRYTLTLDPDRSQLFGDVAVAHGNSDNVLVTGSGERHRFASHWTVVFRKVAGQWKIVRAHSSLDPFGNPMLRAAVRRLVIRFSAGALAVGVALGWTGSWLLSRRRRPAPAGGAA